jgi:hypothetical protein
MVPLGSRLACTSGNRASAIPADPSSCSTGPRHSKTEAPGSSRLVQRRSSGHDRSWSPGKSRAGTMGAGCSPGHRPGHRALGNCQ